jgi:hypothetical protein
MEAAGSQQGTKAGGGRLSAGHSFPCTSPADTLATNQDGLLGHKLISSS